MSSSKRQQARNERALQDLIKNVPGNNVCADCQARNPGWASWSLGIFLCMRCAALHRKLGTHISKVKSLSMDSWSTEQVENMKTIGNIVSNKLYNPQNTRPPMPFDADEVDSAMERFIRQKYQDRTTQEGHTQSALRHNTGSSGSDDHPPPLPPKNNSKFGFRSASSIFPMSSKSKREAAARAHIESSREHRRTPSPPLRNKASKVFGTTVDSGHSGRADGMDKKMAQLRQMGFNDEHGNLMALQRANGNIEKALDILVKMGGNSDPASRSRTPLSATAGITIQRTSEKESPKLSNNPFDVPRTLPQSSQSTGTLAQHGAQTHLPTNGTSTSNPFGLAPSQSQYNLNQQYSLDQSLQNLSLNPSQPLFPNHTGGFPNSQSFQAATTTPLPTIPQHYQVAIYDHQLEQSPIQQSQSYNPFLQQQTTQAQAFNNAIDNTFSTNPYGQQRANTYPQQNMYDQPQQQQQQLYHNQSQPLQNVQQQQQQQYQMVQPQTNPYAIQPPQATQIPQLQQQYMHFQSHTQQLLPQATGKADKSSILALYNYPQFAPAASQQPPTAAPVQMQNQNFPHISYGGPIPNDHQQQHPRSVSSPLASGSKNPFLTNGGSTNAGQVVGAGTGAGINGGTLAQRGHVSQESMSVDVGGWYGQNGRHSPDAFASLSARSMR